MSRVSAQQSSADFSAERAALFEFGYVRLPNLVSEDVLAILGEEVERLSVDETPLLASVTLRNAATASYL